MANDKKDEQVPNAPTSFEINKALAAVCANADINYALSRAVILPNEEPEKVFIIGCDGRILAVAVGDGHCEAPFMIDKKMLAGKVGRLTVDASGQVSFPFISEANPLPYPNVLSALPKRADEDAEVTVSFKPELLAKLLKLFLGSPSVSLFVRDGGTAVVMAGAEAVAVIMPMSDRAEPDAMHYRRMVAAVARHLPAVIASGKEGGEKLVTLESGETIDPETGELVDPATGEVISR